MIMEIRAESNNVKISPRKVRLVADTVRNRSVLQALNILTLTQKRAALVLEKTIKSAVANAVHNAKVKADGLVVKSIEVFEGVAAKRFHPSTRGRTHPYKKRTSHIRIILKEANGAKS